MKESEKDIQKTILEWLAYQKKTFVWRQNSGSHYQDSPTGRHGFKTASVEGISDILGVWNGYPLAIEVKSKTGKATENQMKFLWSFHEAGGIALVVNDLSQVQQVLKEIDTSKWPTQGTYSNFTLKSKI